MNDINTTALDEIIKMTLVSADSAVIDAMKNRAVVTSVGHTRIAVEAAIRNAVGNGALQLAPEQPSQWRIGDPDTWEDDS